MKRSLDPPTDDITTHIQQEVFFAALLILAAAAVVAFDSTRRNDDVLWRLVVGLALLLLATVGAILSRKNISPALWLVLVGSIPACFLAAHYSQLVMILVLLVFPVGVTNLVSHAPIGIALAAIVSVGLLALPDSFLVFTGEQKPLLLSLIWGVTGMIWLLKRPLLVTAREAVISSRRSLDMLEQARDAQGALQKSLKELAESNAQMVRLNKLAQGLRQVAEDERKTKEEFVANVSHELRTPLNMIIGFCEMILNTPDVYGKNIPTTLLSDLEVVLRNSQHLSGLIDDILDLSQIDAGRIALEKETISLEEIIEEAIISVRPLFQTKGLTLETSVQGPLPALYADRTRIREVLLNLLSNAGRFTDLGGVQIRAWQQDAAEYVSVADTGIGISPEEATRLFRPFHQADSSIHRRYSGTGLGLSISKSLVELHDGRMWVESEKGKGTTFFFSLPIDPIALPTKSALRWVNPYQPYDLHGLPEVPARGDITPVILVVERGTALQRILHRQLQSANLLVVETMEEAIDVVNQSPVRVLLVNETESSNLDTLLPDTLPYSLPVIVCAIPELATVAMKMGVTAYLVKPVERIQLLEQIADLPDVKTILVIDDNPEAQRLIKRMLATATRPYKVLRAMSSDQGLEILRRSPVDLILLDLMEPKVNAVRFLEAKQQLAEGASLPVILISAQDPYGQPVTSKYLTVTRAGGLSAYQLVNSLEALMSINCPPGKTTEPRSPTGFPG